MISSTNNARVKRIAEYCRKAKARNLDGVFVVEGIRMVREIPGELLQEIYVTSHFFKNLSNEERIMVDEISSINNVTIEEVSEEVMKKMADTQTPQGVLAIVRQIKWKLEDMLEGNAMLLILENIQDPGNLGNMFRTGEGAGVTGIIMSKDMADAYNPKVVRSTMGAIFRVPFMYVEDIPGEVKLLSDKYGIKSYAAHLKGRKSYDKMNLKAPLAFLIGNEGNGLSDQAAGMADTLIRIPMQGSVESLNAGVAAGVLLFEAARQRRYADMV